MSTAGAGKATAHNATVKTGPPPSEPTDDNDTEEGADDGMEQ